MFKTLSYGLASPTTRRVRLGREGGALRLPEGHPECFVDRSLAAVPFSSSRQLSSLISTPYFPPAALMRFHASSRSASLPPSTWPKAGHTVTHVRCIFEGFLALLSIGVKLDGAVEWSRTTDLLITNQLLFADRQIESPKRIVLRK
jgi:hypothetical protein